MCFFFLLFLEGRYSCIIERDTIPYIQWQTIILEERPNIIVGKNEIKFQCVDKLVSLTCCEAKYDVEWSGFTSKYDEVTPQGCTYKQCILTKLVQLSVLVENHDCIE